MFLNLLWRDIRRRRCLPHRFNLLLGLDLHHLAFLLIVVALALERSYDALGSFGAPPPTEATSPQF